MPSRRRRQPQQEKEWDFFGFPAAFGFAVGGLLALLIAPLYPAPVFVLFLFAVSFGLAHIISHWFRNRVTNKKQERSDEDERERRALAARAAASIENEQASVRRRHRRRN
jgi:membrane protein implicated in regulation of membrane protease activity